MGGIHDQDGRRSGRPRAVLLADGDTDPVPAAWARGLLAFGTCLAERPTRAGWQQVVVLTVPSRAYAAALLAAGWLLGRGLAGTPGNAVAQIDRVAVGDLVRAVTKAGVVLAPFYGPGRAPGTVRIGGSSWHLDALRGVFPASGGADERGRASVPAPGSLVLSHIGAETWPAFFAGGQTSLALVGSKARLFDELSLRLYLDSASHPPDTLHDLLRPRTGRTPVWGSSMVAGGTDKAPDLHADTHTAVLDGSSAIRWLPWLEVPQVLAVIDRSNATESAEATVMQQRATSALTDPLQLGWEPLPGVECLAFEVKL